MKLQRLLVLLLMVGINTFVMGMKQDQSAFPIAIQKNLSKGYFSFEVDSEYNIIQAENWNLELPIDQSNLSGKNLCDVLALSEDKKGEFEIELADASMGKIIKDDAYALVPYISGQKKFMAKIEAFKKIETPKTQDDFMYCVFVREVIK